MFQTPQTWAPAGSRERIETISRTHLGEGEPSGTRSETTAPTVPMGEVVAGIEDLIAASDRLHDEEAFDLNPASNVRGMTAAGMPRMAELMTRALEAGQVLSAADQEGPSTARVRAGSATDAILSDIADEVSTWRKDFTEVRFTA